MMSYKDYFNRNKVIDNSYTCLHFTDNMKIRIVGSELSVEELKVSIIKSFAKTNFIVVMKFGYLFFFFIDV